MPNHPNRGRSNPASNPTPETIRATREAAGLTQTDAARMIYKSLNGWQQWELGVRKMDPAFWELFLLKIKRQQMSAGMLPKRTRSRSLLAERGVRGAGGMGSGVDLPAAVYEDHGHTAQKTLSLTPSDAADRISKLSKVRSILKTALEENDKGEINPSNYNHDDVCALNNSYICLFYRVKEALEFIEAARAPGVEV